MDLTLNIAIVDDLEQDRERLRVDLRNWRRPEGVALGSILCYPNGTALLSALEPGEVQIVFMDICMDEMNGIETALRLREMDTGVLIVFLTTSREFAFDAFPVHPFDYMVKPYKWTHLYKVLNEAVRVLTAEEPEIVIRVFRGQITLPLRTLTAIVSSGHGVEFCLVDGQMIQSRMTFAEVEELTSNDARFLLCNRGLIVNMDHIVSADKDAFKMKNGQSYPIRIRGRAKVLMDFSQYQMSRMRSSAKIREVE